MQGAPRAPAGVHGRAHLPGRAGLPRAAPGLRRPPLASAGDGGAQGARPGARAVEPVPPSRGRAVGRARAEQPRLRAARRDHGAQPHRAGGVQLRRARHREHGGPDAVRHARAEGAVAGAAARRRDPLGVRDDRAGGGQLGRHQHRAADRARRRRVRAERPQVVDLGRDARPLQDPDRDGQDRGGWVRINSVPAAVDDPRPRGHARAPDRAQPAGVRLHRPGGPRRARVRGRARAGLEPDQRGGARLPDRAGTARAGPHPPLHAHASAPPSGRSS